MDHDQFNIRFNNVDQIKAKITGVGGALGSKLVNNEHLITNLDTTDTWIQTRTGIKQRYFVSNEGLTDLAFQALSNALDQANMQAENIDVIIVATTTSDNAFPSCAVRLHGLFNMKSTCLAFDVGAACNGFIYGLKLAKMFLSQPNINHVALIGADVMSRLIDLEDRTTAILFGDGAGAVILSATDENIGFLSEDFGADGTKYDLLYTTNKSTNSTQQFITMQGQEVFKDAVVQMSDSLKKSIAQAGLHLEDINLLIPHQANIRIIEAIQNRLNMDANKIIKTVSMHSNTSAASIPLALDYAKQIGKLDKNQYIAFCGMGAGLTWGSVVMKI